jgi:hypothetical protein
MRNARYTGLDNAIAAGAGINAEMDKFDEAEIAKLGFDKGGAPNTRLSNDQVIHNLTPKVLNKLIDELSPAERNHIKAVIQAAASTPGVTPPGKTSQTWDWLTTNPAGRTF